VQCCDYRAGLLATYAGREFLRYKHEIATLREQVVQLNQTVEEQSRTIAQLRAAQPGDV